MLQEAAPLMSKCGYEADMPPGNESVMTTVSGRPEQAL
jgi:hypothetical protein